MVENAGVDGENKKCYKNIEHNAEKKNKKDGVLFGK